MGEVAVRAAINTLSQNSLASAIRIFTLYHFCGRPCHLSLFSVACEPVAGDSTGMSKPATLKKLSNPYSTGGGGVTFETRIQASFAVLLLANGYAPCLRAWPIKAVHLQAKHFGYETDDVVVETFDEGSGRTGRLFAQIKHDIAFTQGNKTYGEVLQAAWTDFKTNVNPATDAIVLITGPLSGTDLELRTLLEWARTSTSAEDFLKKVQLSNFSSANKQSKLKSLRAHLDSANAARVGDEDVWQFLKCFHVLQYDLDIASGVNHALLSSIIAQFGGHQAELVFSRLVEAVRDINQAAGSVTRETLPAEIVEAFEPRPKAVIAKYLLPSPASPPLSHLDVTSAEVAIAQFAGAWSDTSNKDRAYISALAGESYEDFVRKLSIQLNTPGTVLRYKGGNWSVDRRKDCWGTFGSYILDRHLQLLEDYSKQALSSENSDPFEVNAEGEPDDYSKSLYAAFVDTLALVATQGQSLLHCRRDLIATLPYRVVSAVLEPNNASRWAALSDVLPTIAEAAPEAFLDGVERGLSSKSAIVQLYAAEGDGLFGRNQLLGIIWGLECLAWASEYLPRATVLLGGLDEKDPGGRWANRPSNSLKDIFLPWHPQTTADPDRRLTAIKALAYEYPDTAWKVLVAGLPGVTQSTSGTYRPRWRDFGLSSEDEKVDTRTYWSVVQAYAERLLDLASADGGHIKDLIANLDHLPRDLFDRALKIIQLHASSGSTSGEAQAVWTQLKRFTAKHRTFSSAAWALPDEQLVQIETLVQELQPKAPDELYRDLFGDIDPLGFSSNETWQTRLDKLAQLQQEAVKAVYAEVGWAGTLSFTEKVARPGAVGHAFGQARSLAVDPVDLSRAAGSTLPAHRLFAQGLSSSRYEIEGNEWLSSLGLPNWDTTALANLLVALPFRLSTWVLADELLAKNANLYWSLVEPRLLDDDEEVHLAVRRLLEVNRPVAAVEVVHSFWFRYKKLNHLDALDALMSVPASSEKSALLDEYAAERLIEVLQKSGELTADQLQELEWVYLELLQRPGATTHARNLEQRLADDPDFYLQLICQVYRSKDEPPKEPTEEAKAQALHTYKLLSNWSTPPGRLVDGRFDAQKFLRWVTTVAARASELGRFEVALNKAGKVLVHVPSDPNGMWINEAVAAVLNKAEMEPLRSGYNSGLYNSRGAHWVDPSGNEELALGNTYQSWADEAERAGYVRISASLKALAREYFLQAENVSAMYGLEDQSSHD